MKFLYVPIVIIYVVNNFLCLPSIQEECTVSPNICHKIQKSKEEVIYCNNFFQSLGVLKYSVYSKGKTTDDNENHLLCVVDF